MCSNCTVISCSRRSRKPVDMEICRAKMTSSRYPSSIHFLPNFFDKSQPALIQKACQPPNSASSARRRTRNETEICAEWKLYVNPELRRLFQTATETVAADLRATARKRENIRQSHPAHSVKPRRSVAECAQSGAAGHCREIQFHRWRAVRPLSLTDRIAAGLELIPGKLLWLSSGIYPARTGWLGARGPRIKPVSVLAPST